MNVISREDAITLGLKFYFTGKPCRYGHRAPRYTNNRTCLICSKEYRKAHKIDYKDLPEEQKERQREWQRKNNQTKKRREYMKRYMNKYYHEHKHDEG